jgi:hypothetical protein
MKNRRVSRLTCANKPSLTAAGSVAIGLVIAFGVIDTPSIRAQSPPPKFEVASVKPNSSTGTGSTRFDPPGVNIHWARLLDLIATAYRIPYSRISTTDQRTRDLFTTR